MVMKATAAPTALPEKLVETPAGVVETGDYVPTEEDLARLAKNQKSSAQPLPEPSEPPKRATIIPASIAKRTMEEMEAGKKIVAERTALRNKMLGIT